MVDKTNQKFMKLFSDKFTVQIKKIVVFNVFFIFAFLEIGCQTNLPTPRIPHPVYTLGSGDQLRIGVYGHESLSGIFAVDDTGNISLPLIRRITVRGYTVLELEEHVTEELVKNHIADPRVSIELISIHPFCVIGEVMRQGCFPYSYGLTADKAIAFAGGYTYRAAKNEFVITREDGTVVDNGTHSTPIYSGDVIEVSERYF